MNKYLIVLFFGVFVMGCTRLPDEEVVVNDVKQQKIADYKASLDVLRRVENARIKRLEKLFASSGVDRDELKGYFQRRDFDDELRVYTDQMASLQLISLKRNGRRLEGTAQYQNNYGSRFQITFEYKQSADGWTFDTCNREVQAFLSPEEKKEYLRTKISLAITQFNNDHNRFPPHLKDLVPRYIDAIPPLDWRYDPQTGAIQLS
ncbi:MAG: hypothetical protein ABSH12_07455 [Endomicrobiales bacterium]